MDISHLMYLPVMFGIVEGGAALLGDLFGGLGGLFGVGAATAAEAAPEAIAGADVLGAGAGDALAATAAADIPGFGLGAADQAALYGVTDAGLLQAGGEGAAGLGGAAAAGDLAAGGLTGAESLGLAPGVSTLPANAAAVGEAAGGTSALPTLPATIGGGAESAGGVVPAGSALPLPGSSFDVASLSGANLGGLTNTGPQFAELGASDVSDPGAFASLDTGASAGGTGGATAADTGAGVDLTAASDSSAIGGGGPGPGYDIGTVPPSGTASQADISGGMLQPQADAATYSAPGAGGGGKVSGGAGGGGSGGGFDWWKAAGLGLAAAPLALTLGRGQQQMPEQGLQSQAISTNLSAASQQLLNQAMQGQVTPGQQATLTLDRQRMINQARQELFNQGIANPEGSSAWRGMLANIDNQIAVEQQQFLTANIQEAFTGTGQAQQNLTNLAKNQIDLDNAYTQAIAGASGSLGRFLGQAGGRIL